ncbi:helix-turn-helix transcriptional regulator [Streptomyces sp. NBC_00286]|uniref:helix-turn-helix transcriptional regulator n=1 Tax=Streptomyces sp. NBC_00286 TaxID=2975701 RepID=UPI002E27F9AB|nr:LuxR C-terminal-related transcriptional regulator [Streptomyces sp. NBC_00286]
MTYERDAKTLELPWPFTGREAELDLIRRSLTAGRRGIVVTGRAGCGKTRLVTEAVRDSGCTKVTGTPGTRQLPFAAFAHLLPETVSLHRAVQLLANIRLLIVDDAHLLDDASAALVHQLAVHGRTRLIVVVTDGEPVPDAISRLWTGELLPRLALEPLPREDLAQLVTAGAGGTAEPLTVNRLHRLCQGDLRLLRALLDALRERGSLTRGSDAWSWRGPVPVTAPLRERTAGALAGLSPDERAVLEELAFSEPLPLDAGELDLRVLELLEAQGLVAIDDHSSVRLAHPLHGPVLRSEAGQLRARRLSRTPSRCGPALEAEGATLARRIEQADVRDVPTPIGDWLAGEGAGPDSAVPAGYAVVRARYARLRGELREAVAWAREGMRAVPGDLGCRAELAVAEAREGMREVPDVVGCRVELAVAQAQLGNASAGAREMLAAGPASGRADTWLRAARGDIAGALESITGDDAYALNSGAVTLALPQDVHAEASRVGGQVAYALHDAVRLGEPALVADRLAQLPGEPAALLSLHADALARGDGPALDRAAERLEQRGFLLFAAEAHAHAASAHDDPRAARMSRTRAVTLARRCQGARTPALSGLVLGELTARQRQIVTLAAAGLSNREIAEQLTLSVRTVGNHLHSAYTRLGGTDRGSLPRLVDDADGAPLPDAWSA